MSHFQDKPGFQLDHFAYFEKVLKCVFGEAEQMQFQNLSCRVILYIRPPAVQCDFDLHMYLCGVLVVCMKPDAIGVAHKHE